MSSNFIVCKRVSGQILKGLLPEGKDMSNTIEKLYGGPAIVLTIIGILMTSFLFYFMFKYADEGNLFMVIAIPLIISVFALIVGKFMSSVINK